MLSARKRRLLDDIAAQCDVHVDQIEDAYPCTPMQQGAAIASNDAPGMLFTHFAYKLSPSLSNRLDAFRRAWQIVWDRTPMLRTRIVCFDSDEGGKRHVQAVLRGRLDWTIFDDVDQYRAGLLQLALQYGGPLVRPAFSRDKKYFVLSIHHSLYDAWSLSLLWSDIGAALAPQALRPRSSFSKFSAFLQHGMPQTTAGFWKRQFLEYKGPSYLKRKDCTGADAWPDTNVLLSGDISLAWPDRDSISPATRTRTAWACTLMQLFHTQDILFFELTTGRNCQVDGIDEIIGPTITTIPVRLERRPDQQLAEFLKATQQQSRELLAHEHGYHGAYEAMISEEQKPRHILNVVNKMQDRLHGSVAILDDIGLQDITDASSQKNSADWGVNIELFKDRAVWNFFADDKTLPPASIEFITSKFPVWMKRCASP